MTVMPLNAKGKKPYSGDRSLYFQNKNRGTRGGSIKTIDQLSETRDDISLRA